MHMTIRDTFIPIMHVRLPQRVGFHHLKQILESHFPSLASESYSFFFFLMWTGLPSSGSSRVPTSGFITPYVWYLSHLTSWPPLRSSTTLVLLFPLFFHCHHPSPSFSITYLNSALNMLNHPHFSKHSCLNQQSHLSRLV